MENLLSTYISQINNKYAFVISDGLRLQVVPVLYEGTLEKKCGKFIVIVSARREIEIAFWKRKIDCFLGEQVIQKSYGGRFPGFEHARVHKFQDHKVLGFLK